MKKNYLKNKKKILIISVIVILILILIIAAWIANLEKANKNVTNQTEYESIEQILNKYGCKYVKETKSKDSNYSKDIYVEFKYNTFENNNSNKRFYENIISTIALFLNDSYRLIDDQKELLVEVQKQINSTGAIYYTYMINGDKNYFSNKESSISLENYKEDNLTKIVVNSNIINSLISNKWKSNINFGTKESNFDKYEIYFDEGIEVRKISEKIFNIVFTKNHTEEIVSGIKVGTSFDEIIRKLGQPTFGNKDGNLIGYRNEEIYVFFSEGEISIYRYEKVKTEKFEELLGKYLEKQIELKEFMNELTYLWPDYSLYAYDSNYINIRYPLQGLEILMTSDDSKGIQIYGNYSNVFGMEKYIKDNKITGKTEENLVYIDETGRIDTKAQLLYICEMASGMNTIQNISELYGYYNENNRINFVSKDGTRPNISIGDTMNSGFWYTDTKFIYSVKNEGIFLYDLETNEKVILEQGNEEYTFENYENNILTYDEGKIIKISN